MKKFLVIEFIVIALLCIMNYGYSDVLIETKIVDRNDSYHKWIYDDLLNASYEGGAKAGFNAFALIDSTSTDSTMYYWFMETTAVAFLVSGKTPKFNVIAETCRASPGLTIYHFPIDTLLVESTGYYAWSPVGCLNEHIRFRFAAIAGNESTNVSEARINRSWP